MGGCSVCVRLLFSLSRVQSVVWVESAAQGLLVGGHKWEQEGQRSQRTKERGAQSFLSLPLGQIFVGQAVATKNEECLESDVTRWVG